MDVNVVAGLVLVLLGLGLYLAASDLFTAVPGNVAFFSGVVVATWESQKLKSLFYLAVASLVFVFCALGVVINQARKGG